MPNSRVVQMWGIGDERKIYEFKWTVYDAWGRERDWNIIFPFKQD